MSDSLHYAFLHGLPPETTGWELHSALSEFGPVEFVRLHANGRTGNVAFRTAKACEDATYTAAVPLERGTVRIAQHEGRAPRRPRPPARGEGILTDGGRRVLFNGACFPLERQSVCPFPLDSLQTVEGGEELRTYLPFKAHSGSRVVVDWGSVRERFDLDVNSWVNLGTAWQIRMHSRGVLRMTGEADFFARWLFELLDLPGSPRVAVVNLEVWEEAAIAPEDGLEFDRLVAAWVQTGLARPDWKVTQICTDASRPLIGSLDRAADNSVAFRWGEQTLHEPEAKRCHFLELGRRAPKFAEVAQRIPFRLRIKRARRTRRRTAYPEVLWAELARLHDLQLPEPSWEGVAASTGVDPGYVWTYVSRLLLRMTRKGHFDLDCYQRVGSLLTTLGESDRLDAAPPEFGKSLKKLRAKLQPIGDAKLTLLLCNGITGSPRAAEIAGTILNALPQADSDAQRSRLPLEILAGALSRDSLPAGAHAALGANGLRLLRAQTLAPVRRALPELNSFHFWCLVYGPPDAEADPTQHWVLLTQVRGGVLTQAYHQQFALRMSGEFKECRGCLLLYEQNSGQLEGLYQRLVGHRFHVIRDDDDVQAALAQPDAEDLLLLMQRFPTDHLGFIGGCSHQVVKRAATEVELTRFLTGPPGRVASLYSIRKSGKSTFCLSTLYGALGKEFVYLNIETVRGTVEDFLCSQTLQRADELLPALVRAIEDTIAAIPVIGELQPIFRTVAEEDLGRKGLIVFLDEIELLRAIALGGEDEQDRRWRSERIYQLILSFAHHYRLIVVGLDPWWHQGVLPESHRVEFADPLPFPLFNRKELTELCSYFVGGRVHIDPEFTAWLLEHSGGHPVVARRYMERALRSACEEGLQSNQTLTLAHAQRWEGDEGSLTSKRELLGPRLANLIGRIARSESPYRRALAALLRALATTPEALSLPELRERYAGPPGWSLSEVLAVARQTNFVVVEPGEPPRVRVAVPLLGRYLYEEQFHACEL